MSKPKILALAALAGLIACPQSRAEEAPKSEAYVQTFTFQGMTVKARVKVLKAGTYVVAAGAAKKRGDNVLFHKGIFGAKYFDTKVIKGEAGDVFEVEITPSKAPPLNRNCYAAVFKSEDDIETTP